VSVFEYTDYKEFLRDYIARLPKKGRGEINRIANFLNVHPTLLSQILGGTRDFSTEQIHKLCGYMGLQPLESDFLILLLQCDRAGTVELKKYYKTKIEELKKSSLSISNRLARHKTLSELERSVFYSSWTYLAVWLFTSVGKGQTIEAISQHFSVTRAHASEILNFLKTSQLCIEEDGFFKMRSQHIHLGFGSPFLARHHANWRMKSLERIDNLADEEMMFTSPFSISKKDFARIREEIVKLIKTTSSIIKDSPAENVACMNFDLFWIKKSG
jgi:uncharacterized protein (TIGR02147 family)